MKRILFVLMAFAVMLTGCSHKTYEAIETSTEKKDSVEIHIVDSVRWETKTQIKDSVNVRDSVVIRVDSQGNEIGRSEWHYKEKYKEVKDSTAYYKNLCDSLVRKSEEKDTVTIHDIEYRDKPLTKWQTFKQEVGGIAIGISVAAIIALGVRLYRKYRKKLPI
jgi:major membrane immunogen (membrane-anchored lipoprotein)